MSDSTAAVTGTDPATPCIRCGQPLNQEDPRFTRTIHPACADARAAEYVAAGRPWTTTGPVVPAADGRATDTTALEDWA